MAGPTQTAVEGAAGRWHARPWLSRAIRAVAYLVPVAAAFGLSSAAAELLPPEKLGVSIWLWWPGVALASTVAMVAVEKLTRRLLPLAGLLQLSMVFPNNAPSRYKHALRSGTTRQLERRIQAAKADLQAGTADDELIHGEYLLDIVALLAKHDKMTRGHSERVRAYSDLIAEELRLPTADREKLHWAALLHDAGKLDVPSSKLTRRRECPTSSRCRSGLATGCTPPMSITKNGTAPATPLARRARRSASPAALCLWQMPMT